MRIWAISVVLLAAGFSASAQQPATTTAKTVELCDVVKTPESFAGQALQVEGTVLGQNPDKTILIGYCQFGIKLVYSDKVKTQPNVQALYKSILRGNPGTIDKDISGEFTGVFHYDVATREYFLEVMKVDHLKFPSA